MPEIQDSKSFFESVSTDWRNLPLEQILRPDYGDFSLDGFRSDITSINRILDDIQSVLPQILNTKDGVNGVYNFSVNVNSLMHFLRKVSVLTRDEYAKSRSEMPIVLQQFRLNTLDFWTKITGLIAYKKLSDNDDSEITKGFLSDFKSEIDKTKGNIKALEENIELQLKEFEERYSPLFKRIELAKQEETFTSEAYRNNQAASQWLIGIGASILILFVVLYLVVKHFCFELPCTNNIITTYGNGHLPNSGMALLYLEIFKAVFYRLLVLTICVYILKFCVNNYQASKHNYTLNVHRANALHGARWLTDRITSPQAQDQILVQSSNAIFAHQPTGYNSKDPENINLPIDKIVEKVGDAVK